MNTKIIKAVLFTLCSNIALNTTVQVRADVDWKFVAKITGGLLVTSGVVAALAWYFKGNSQKDKSEKRRRKEINMKTKNKKNTNRASVTTTNQQENSEKKDVDELINMEDLI